jgi:hypothetical protein
VSETLDRARRRLADLEAERAALPDRLKAAQREEDPTAWLRASNRAEELVEDLEAARAALLPLELAEAWRRAEQCLAAEPAAHAAVVAAREAQARCREARPQPGCTRLDGIEWELAMERLGADTAAAELELANARDATALALIDVENRELDLIAATGEDPTEDAEGLRARPRPLQTCVITPLPDRAAHEPARALAERVGHSGTDGSLVLLPGTVPPRWAAARMHAGVFDPPEPDDLTVDVPPIRATVTGALVQPTADKQAKAERRTARQRVLDGEAATAPTTPYPAGWND